MWFVLMKIYHFSVSFRDVLRRCMPLFLGDLCFFVGSFLFGWIQKYRQVDVLVQQKTSVIPAKPRRFSRRVGWTGSITESSKASIATERRPMWNHGRCMAESPFFEWEVFQTIAAVGDFGPEMFFWYDLYTVCYWGCIQTNFQEYLLQWSIYI